MKSPNRLGLIAIFFVFSAHATTPSAKLYNDAIDNADFRSLTGYTMKCWGHVARGTYGGKAGIDKVAGWVDSFHAKMLRIQGNKATFTSTIPAIEAMKAECEAFQKANENNKVEISYTKRLEMLGERAAWRNYSYESGLNPNALLTAIVGRPMTVCGMGTLNVGGALLVVSVGANVKGAYCESTTLNRWFEIGVGVGGDILEYSGLGLGFYGAGGTIDRKGGNMASVYGSQGGAAILIASEAVGTEDMPDLFHNMDDNGMVPDDDGLQGGGVILAAYGTRNVNVAIPIVPMSQHSPRLLLKLYTGKRIGRTTIR